MKVLFLRVPPYTRNHHLDAYQSEPLHERLLRLKLVLLNPRELALHTARHYAERFGWQMRQPTVLEAELMHRSQASVVLIYHHHIQMLALHHGMRCCLCLLHLKSMEAHLADIEGSPHQRRGSCDHKSP